jgi:DNA-binding SARP family transcriptional activator
MAQAAGADAYVPTRSGDLECLAFQKFPYGLLVLGGNGQVISRNLAATDLLDGLRSDASARDCCSLFKCGERGTPLAGTCLTELARRSEGALPEMRLDSQTAAGPRVLWVLASRMDDSDYVIVQVRPGSVWDRRRRSDPEWMSGQRLHIHALGSTRVERGDNVLGGQWLDQRTGQLLKYLVVERHRFVYVDEIGENLWPEADYGVASSVRYYIHALRRTLEPGRGSRKPSSFIVSSGARYRLNLDRVEVDADHFEEHTARGLALAQGDPALAVGELELGLGLYRGEFLADSPYAEWAIAERHRLHELACAGLRKLADIRFERDGMAAATRCVERLAGMQPYDEDVHRRLLELKLAEGRRSDAMRHYSILRARIKRTFGHEPGFKLTDLSPEAARSRESIAGD